MFVVCKGCSAKLSWNGKVHRPLRELHCPHCGETFQKSTSGQTRDPIARHEFMVSQFRDGVRRLEEAMRAVRKLPELLQNVEQTLVQLQGESDLQLTAAAGELEFDKEVRGGVA